MTTILQGIGWFLLKIYEFFESCHIPASYALMLVVFTILIKVVIFPLSYKGKKSMMKMSMLESKQKKATTARSIRKRCRSSTSARRSTPWAAACGPSCPCPF